MTVSLDSKEFIAGFLTEAEELLLSASTDLLTVDVAMRKGAAEPRAVRDLFRALHTLKGLAAMVGAASIVDIAHEMETLVRAGDAAGGRVPVDGVDTLFQGLRAMEERVNRLGRGLSLPDAPRSLLDQLSALQVTPTTTAPAVALALDAELLARLSASEQEQMVAGIASGRRLCRIEFSPSAALSAAGVNITSVREGISRIGDVVKVLPRNVAAQGTRAAGVVFDLLVITGASDEDLSIAGGSIADAVTLIPAGIIEEHGPSPATLEPAPADDADTQKRNVVRVDVTRLDDALDHLSTLVVTRARLERAARELAHGTGSVRSLLQIVAESSNQLRDLRAAIMRARMVSVNELLDRAPLIVRGLSKSSGKQVRLHIDAGDSELDKSVADRLFPAVVHLLRNAVDHAIETPEERRAAGKPEEGRLVITCRGRSDNQLELVVEDDGRGVDRVKVAARAREPVPEGFDDLLTMITRPGLSTRDEVSQTSGRGMGMDIVRRVVVDELGGEMHMISEPGVGTRFFLIVPLSMTILEVFSFRCAGRTFVVPVSSVEDLAEIEPLRVHRTPGGRGGARLFSHRNASIPLFRLSALLRLSDDEGTRGTKAIIVRRNTEVFGFEVDRLIGQQEVVVRPLHDPLVKVVGVAGSTDLGDGQATLVLDLHALAQSTPRMQS
ncbi:MAG: chemotaxis protein CheW [Deltaproteobacteria bacterium]|nr:chemotaxis protein CheW [Deltaproteobacteria bacterium]